MLYIYDDELALCISDHELSPYNSHHELSLCVWGYWKRPVTGLEPSCAHAVRMWALRSGAPAAPPRRGNQALAAGSETRRRSVDGVRLLKE